MGFNFPASPSVGAIYTPATGVSYMWDGVGWRTVVPAPTAQDRLILPELSTAPTTGANEGALYSKDVSGRTELFYKDDSGAEIQITRQGRLKTATDAVYYTMDGLASQHVLVPNWATEIDISLMQCSLTGNEPISLQIGANGGVEAASYFGTKQNLIATATASGSVSIAWTLLAELGSWAGHGHIFLRKTHATNNTWTMSSVLADYNGGGVSIAGGSKTLTGGLIDRVVLTRFNTATFDGGTLAVRWR